MTRLDPQYWQEGPKNGKDKILQLINYFEVPLAAANFDKTKVLRVALIPGHTQPVLQTFYCKISLGKNVSIQEKRIPKFADIGRASYVFLIIEQCD